jgi:hypothetical protein
MWRAIFEARLSAVPGPDPEFIECSFEAQSTGPTGCLNM